MTMSAPRDPVIAPIPRKIGVHPTDDFARDLDGLLAKLSIREASAFSHPPSPESLSRCSTPEPPIETQTQAKSFTSLRILYLFVTLVIMLADGLQGTHLYVLYEGYGYTVAYLYCLGFATGAFLSPVTGPLVDKIGRKKAAILYCVLEMFINWLEQYPSFTGLIASRMIGGFTTNLLCCVFEAWLDTEYRRRGFSQKEYDIVMRDSIVIRDLAAIFSGYMAHVLAEYKGAVGPFQGAVACTGVALVVVSIFWTENYGTKDGEESRNVASFLKEALTVFQNDSKTLRVGIIQGLTSACIQIFVFLWAPTLRQVAQSAPKESMALDQQGEPAYGIIFGAFMAAGVVGGLLAPSIQQLVGTLFFPRRTTESKGPVECVATLCYFLSALLLLVPGIVPNDSQSSFAWCLTALIAYEGLIGVFLPLEGVMRGLYFPETARASMMTLPSMIVNLGVAVGVVSTNFIRMETAFTAIGCVMLVCTVLQATLIPTSAETSIISPAMASSEIEDNEEDDLSLSCHDLKLNRFSAICEDDSEFFKPLPTLRRVSGSTTASEESHYKID